MKKFLLCLAVLISFVSIRPAEAVQDYKRYETELTLTAGYRQDNLDWSIAGSSVNILSELKWEDIKILQAKATYRTFSGDMWYLRSSIGLGFIIDGYNQDSDYDGNDRTLEFSRSNNSSDAGSVLDATGVIGFVLPLSSSFRAIPLVGLAYNAQYLTMTDGNQTITTAGRGLPPLGPFSGLDSEYNANWYGPLAGVDLVYKGSSFKLRSTFEYHYVRYFANADWNLRSDFAHPVSFEHTANGTGLVFSLSGDYTIDKTWSVTAAADIQSWKTMHGTDKTFFSSGAVSYTRLNEVNWDSYSFSLGVNFNF